MIRKLLNLFVLRVFLYAVKFTIHHVHENCFGPNVGDTSSNKTKLMTSCVTQVSIVSPTFQSCYQCCGSFLTPDDLERIYENVNGIFLS